MSWTRAVEAGVLYELAEVELTAKAISREAEANGENVAAEEQPRPRAPYRGSFPKAEDVPHTVAHWA